MLQLILPATSANLGPGFDTLGLAMSLYLDIFARESPELRIEVVGGRDALLISRLQDNLILDTYKDVLDQQRIVPPTLYLKVINQIPLGFGCGSSAAALLAGVHLANHFGNLNWTPQQILTEACLREGHPDNVAACALGGMTVSGQQGSEIFTATFGTKLTWRLLLALPTRSFATEKARALLPPTYTRADAVFNVQRSSLLVAAFAQNRPDLLQTATQDRIHQPWRSEACPLLPLLLPLAGHQGIYSVSLSGAGPSVLLITDPEAPLAPIEKAIRAAAQDPDLELLTTSIAGPTEVRIPSV